MRRSFEDNPAIPGESLDKRRKGATRNTSLRSLWLILLVLLAFSPFGFAQPNIVLIMVDNLDVDTLEYLLEQSLLPNIQRTIVNRGIHFRNFFVTNPLCSPSRASFLTGRYPHRHGVLTNTPVSSGSPPGSIEAFGNPTVLPGWLQALLPTGYVTAHIGKYLSFYGSGTDPAKPIFLPFVPQGWTPVFLGIFPLAPHADIMPEQRSALNGYSDIWNDDVDPPHRYLGTRFDCLFGLCSDPPKPNFNETDDSDKPLWVRAKPQIDGAVDRPQNRPAFSPSPGGHAGRGRPGCNRY